MPTRPTMPTIPPQINEADGLIDELQVWFLPRAEAEGCVYASVLRQLLTLHWGSSRMGSQATHVPTDHGDA
jgi:hypothetical protein